MLDVSEFVSKAHKRAEDQLYPLIFGTERKRLSFEETLFHTGSLGDTCDGSLAIDVIVHLEGLPIWMKAPLSFSFQERFRRKQYAHLQDLTITEWNLGSGLPSELYKIVAQYFLYAYYDDEQDQFLDAVNVITAPLVRLLADRKIMCEPHQNARKQSFISIPFQVLQNNNLLTLWISRDYRIAPEIAYLQSKLNLL